MAAEGISHSEIARRLNEEGIPTRYMYHKMKGDNFPDKQPHVKIKKWDNSAVRDIVTNETYLGTLFWNRAKCGMDTDKKRVEQPREKWIVVEGQHEALVSQEVFKKANDNLVGLDVSGRKTGVRNLFFVCGYCGKGLQRRSRANGKYYCRSRTQELENECQKVNVDRKALEDAVLSQVRVMADILMEEREVRRKAGKNNRKETLEGIVSDSAKEAARWKATKMRLYEQYKAGDISREVYMERIENGRIRMEELERARGKAQTELERMQVAVCSEKIPDKELAELSELETFDKDRLKALIEKVVVYGENAMEIVWKVENPFKAEHSI